MSTIFSRIIAGEIPCHKVAETEHHIAFLDIQPMVKGHTLVVPKIEVDYLFDMEADAYSHLWEFARKVAKGLDMAVPCKRVGVGVVGLEVPHTHIHLLPLQTIEDTVFTKPRLHFSKEELEALAIHIATFL
jgi:histidine triad (HIT) family protein